ncbi:hypothetical protein [Salinirubrum litoreum]|uniref:Uncharacterized protein n=1 Tax=Salinirubrum litoreum TaxID=1126234 RepID=A0ABD5RCC8_9EURY|nr:hypothetical protein [Salinirubrum litoreum]
MRRKTQLGFVVSLHLVLFSTAAAAGGATTAGLAFGTVSALVLAVTLFYELSVPT